MENNNTEVGAHTGTDILNKRLTAWYDSVEELKKVTGLSRNFLDNAIKVLAQLWTSVDKVERMLDGYEVTVQSLSS